MKRAVIQINEVLKHKIEELDRQGIKYFVMPVCGDSMTCEDERSIPDGSHVLVSEHDVFSPYPALKNLNVIPINLPVILGIELPSGELQYLCKEVKTVFQDYVKPDEIKGFVEITCYNEKYPPSQKIPLSKIKKVFLVQSVVELIEN